MKRKTGFTHNAHTHTPLNSVDDEPNETPYINNIKIDTELSVDTLKEYNVESDGERGREKNLNAPQLWMSFAVEFCC